MAEGAQDWFKVISIRGVDAEGNPRDVLVDSLGRLYMLAYGTVTVAGTATVTQADSTREVQGSDGETLHTLAVDDQGRLVMIPYGTVSIDGTALVTQASSEREVQGSDGEALVTLAVDSSGRLMMLPYGYTGSTYVPLKVDADGNLVALMKGDDGAALHTVATDTSGRLLMVLRDPTSEYYAAINSEGYLGALIRGATDIRLDLELWLRFRASEGTTIHDYSGNAHGVGAYSGAGLSATYGAGVVGDAIELDGSNDYVQVDHHADLTFTTEDFTIEGWVHLDDLDAVQTFAAKGAPTTDGWDVLLHDNGNVYVRRLAPGGDESVYCAHPGYGVFFHLVVTRSGTDVKIYLNAVEQATTGAWTGDLITNARDLHVGIYDNESTRPLDGRIDEFRIYRRALSADEVTWRYRRTKVTVADAYRPLSVDPEGRLEVKVADFAYKDQVLSQGGTTYPAGGNQSEQSATVPSGKMWIITSALMHANGFGCNSMDIGIYDGTNNHVVAYEYGAGAVYRAFVHGQLTLKPGDRVNFGWGAAASAYVTHWAINGYELDYPY